MALDSTVGGPNANSYVDAQFADDYMANHPYGSEWTGAANHEPHLIYATIILDNWIVWDGEKDSETEDTQALEFPRDFDWDIEGDYDGIIPDEIKKAQVEMAYHLLTSNEIFDKQDIEDVKVGPIRVEFDTNKVQTLPSMVLALISKFGVMKGGLGGGIGYGKLVRA